MADLVVATAMLLTAFMATGVVLTRDPARQAITLSAYGLVLGILFLVLQAPDVAMSQAAVGTVVVPLIVILTIHAIRRNHVRTTDDGRAMSERTESTARPVTPTAREEES